MKVYESQNAMLHGTQKRLPGKGAESGEFQKVMDQVRLQSDKTEGVTTQAPLGVAPGGVHILEGAQKLREPLGVVETKQVVEGLEQTLDIVDFYAAKLSDTSFPLREMNPIIGHLEERLEGMRSLEATPGLPDHLKSILSDAVITIGTEIAKFRRGDYS